MKIALFQDGWPEWERSFGRRTTKNGGFEIVAPEAADLIIVKMGGRTKVPPPFNKPWVALVEPDDVTLAIEQLQLAREAGAGHFYKTPLSLEEHDELLQELRLP
jgi:hypothetical protein